MRFRLWLSHLFCRHEWIGIGWYEADNPLLRYPIHIYSCRKCGKRIEVDGRYDHIKSVN